MDRTEGFGREGARLKPNSDEPLWIEPDGSNVESVRALGHRIVDLIVDRAASAGARPPLERSIPDSMAPYEPSRTGRSADDLVAELAEYLSHGMNPSHPGYLGHMDSIASTLGIFSEAAVSALNNNMLAFEMGPRFTELEQRLMQWAARLFGLGANGATATLTPATTPEFHPARPTGTLVSGGTLANMTGLLVARNRAAGRERLSQGLAARPERLVFLATENAHFSFLKTANLLGLGREGWIHVPADALGRVRIDAMKAALRQARAEGAQPFCIVGVAGTTVTGSLDPLPELAALAHSEGLWFHVDAAYGGALALAPSLRARLAGIEQADSITFNPQKWLFVPKTSASILFRDEDDLDRHLREAFLYGNSNQSANGRTTRNLGEWTLQGTRRVGALKLYLTLEHFGADLLGRLIERCHHLAGHLVARIQSEPELELLQAPDLNIVCFRHRGPTAGGRPELEGAALDDWNARLHAAIESGGRAWLSFTGYRGARWLRAVILHPRCDEALLDRIVDDVLRAARA